MTDRRTWPANGRVAHESLRGQVEGVVFVPGAARHLTVPVADLCRAPGGGRDTQLLWGQGFLVLEDGADGWSFGRAEADGYVGYVETAALGDVSEMTHHVTARATHVYSKPDMKSPEGESLPFGARLALSPAGADFWDVAGGGFVPRQHVASMDMLAEDAVAVAESLLGAPYLWGGSSAFGIDCSGLVQAALMASGLACPRDSDQQEAAFEAVTDAPRRGDLVFWKGHVGMLMDTDTLIHANAHHMAVAVEPFAEARARIAAREFGEITKVARPPATAK
ncbi:MAG: NlpC/P60 family protein [Pseudomonadota bacterium]